jgi:hypothetical protein
MAHRFQSFWWGEPLSPYQWLCLKSFADFGHGFDLYTFDPQTSVPSDVRVCDAAEIAARNEFFVGEDALGKWAPATFSNVFRYKLLVEKGGWWVDTDVVCLSDNIPDCVQFIARQDDDLVDCAVMHFAPQHPVMIRCLELAAGMGRSARPLDSGPRLLTRMLQEHGQMDRVLAASVCYPVHYYDALDVLRPSKLGRIAARLGGSLFLHLWNSMLTHSGVRKTYLPPKGSMLRHLVEQHQVGGWTGEYDEAGLEPFVKAHAELSEQMAANERLEEANEHLEEANERLETGLSEQMEANERLQAELARRAAEGKRLECELRDRIAAGDRLQAELDAIARSHSWRVTKPLRVLRRLLAPVRGQTGAS